MKYIITILVFCFLGSYCMAQGEGSNFALGVIVPDLKGDLEETNRERLEAKTIQLVNNSGEAVVGYSNDFALYATMTLDELQVAEGGMQRVTVANVELSFHVKQMSSGIVFSSMTKRVRGSGSTDAQAIRNAISHISSSDKEFRDFLSSAKGKIRKFYSDNCSSIMNAASVLEANHEYVQTISMLFSVPVGASCYQTAQSKVLKLYAKYKSDLCTGLITYAKSEIAMGNFQDALMALNNIEPASGCADEAQSLIAEIERKNDKYQQQAYTLEAQRQKALEAIAYSYYSKKSRVRR